jgi:hypothetical protein
MSQQAPSGAALQAMEALTAQWYNAVVGACHLDPATFQLAQGFPVLGTTSPQLWTTLDALPTHTLTQFWNPAQMSSFAQTYGAVLSALSPPAEAPFVTAMGDYYTAWNSYKRKQFAQGPLRVNLLQLFHEWEQANMPSGQGAQAYKLFAGMMGSAPIVAEEMWVRAGGPSGDVTLAYDTTAEQLQTQLEQAGGPITVQMDSATESKSVSNAWASGKMGGLFDFFWGGGGANYDQLTLDVAQSGVQVETRIEHLLTFSFTPLEQPQPDDPILKKCVPWYDSAALAQAFQNPNAAFWRDAPPTWEETFGPGGTLTSIKTSLVLAGGISTTITSAATFASEDQAAVKGSASFGFFPFFEAEASGGWQHEFTFSDTGAMTVRSSVPNNLSVVLGAIVTPTASIFGAG